jgi:hypothetical protein
MTATPKPAKKQDRTTMALLLVAAFVAVGGIGFAIGHLTGGSSAAAANNPGGGNRGGFARATLAPGQTFNVGQFGSGAGGAGRLGGLGGLSGGISGTVASIDGSTMTITLANGSTVTVDLSGTTTYHNETTGSSTDVKTGSAVTVQIDTSTLAGASASPGASGGQTLTAKDVLITTP